MQTAGQHLILDLWLSSAVEDPDLEKLFALVRTNFKVVRETNERFTPHGLTAVFILSESHFAIHTYPEHNYVSIDLYICTFDIDLAAVTEEIKAIFPIERAVASVIVRGACLVDRNLHARPYRSTFPLGQEH